MKHTNFLGQIFKTISDIVNGAEKSFLDLLSALVPYFVPVIPAYLTYYHTIEQMNFPPRVALTAAFVVEVLGITAVSTAIRFYRHNQRYKDAKNKAPFWLAIGTYVFYLVVVMMVNVILEIVAGTRSNAVITAIALFSLLSVPSGVLISIRTQFSEMLEERQERRSGGAIPALNSFNLESVEGGRPKLVKTCASCGKEFKTTFPNAVTCSAACRQRLHRQKSRNVA
jgi:uncharacterized membrane protein YidH (DUF202 family)